MGKAGAIRLDHVNITSAACEATKDFYVKVVGLTVGDRPPFQFGGYWLYAGEFPVVHLNDALSPGSTHRRDLNGMAALDHVSFRMSGLSATRQKIEDLGLKYRVNVVPRTGDVQLFVDDPNGVTVELTFGASEMTDAERAQYGSLTGAASPR
jgi:catechol 2,3-dioxygenase-like lactoylglutathione lyase family enzyme